MKNSRKLTLALFGGYLLLSAGSMFAQGGTPPVVEVAKVIPIKEGYAKKYPAKIVPVRDVALPARVSGKIEYTIRKCSKAGCGAVFELNDVTCNENGCSREKKCAKCEKASREINPVCKKCGSRIEDGITMEGQFVKKGDLLIKLEDTTYVAARDAARAQKEQAKAQIEQAKTQDLQADAQIEQANAQDLQANAQIEQANAQIEQANAQIAQANALIAQANAQIKQAEAAQKYATENYERENKLKKISAEKTLEAATRDRDQAEAALAAARSQKAAADGQLAAAKAQLAAAKGQVASAKAAKAQAKAAMSAAKATKVSAKAAKAAAEAQLSAADAALTDAENNLSYTLIKADFDGKIGKFTYSVGNYVTPNSGALAQLTLFDPIYVTFSIGERDFLTIYGSVDDLVKNSVVRVRLSDGREYSEPAVIQIPDNKIDSQTGTIKLWARLKNNDMKLTPGSLVEVILTKKIEEEFPAVPVNAVQISRQGQYVWVVAADNSVSARPVETGSTLGSWRVITSKSVAVGETVVSAGAHKIIPVPNAKLMITPVPRKESK